MTVKMTKTQHRAAVVRAAQLINMGHPRSVAIKAAVDMIMNNTPMTTALMRAKGFTC